MFLPARPAGEHRMQAALACDNAEVGRSGASVCTSVSSETPSHNMRLVGRVCLSMYIGSRVWRLILVFPLVLIFVVWPFRQAVGAQVRLLPSGNRSRRQIGGRPANIHMTFETSFTPGGRCHVSVWFRRLAVPCIGFRGGDTSRKLTSGSSGGVENGRGMSE